MPAEPRQDELESVSHLLELGYVDPVDTAARESERRVHLDDQLRQAIDLLNGDRTHEAVSLLERLASENPESIPPRQLLAEAHASRRDWASVRAHLDWLAHYSVVTPRLAMITATFALREGDLRSAREDLEYAAHVDPTLPGVHALLGTALGRTGDWESAEGSFERAVRQNPDDATARDGLSAAALHRGDFESAARCALEALERDMGLYRAHYHLGVALTRLGRAKAAEAALQACLRLDPSRAAPLYWMSRIAREQRRDAAAAAEYRARGRQLIHRRRRP